jgi:hypothetical protein
MTKIAGSGSRIQDPDPNPDPLVRGINPPDPDQPQNFMDPEHWYIYRIF